PCAAHRSCPSSASDKPCCAKLRTDRRVSSASSRETFPFVFGSGSAIIAMKMIRSAGLLPRTEVGPVPVARFGCDLFERTGLLEQVARPGHDDELLFAMQAFERRPVQVEHDEVVPA